MNLFQVFFFPFAFFKAGLFCRIFATGALRAKWLEIIFDHLT
jgi:hypothetical protein